MIGLIMFVMALILLLSGVPVAFVFGGTAIFFTAISLDFGFEIFNLLPFRIYGIMQNSTLMSIPLFVLMGSILEKSGMAEKMLKSSAQIFSRIEGGLALSVLAIGVILATTTGIVGASISMLGLVALPVMIKYKYNPVFASGVVLASGTLGQIVPPSIILIILADVMNLSIGEIFKASILPSIILIIIYVIYILWHGLKYKNNNLIFNDKLEKINKLELLKVLIPPLLIMFGVLGSIIFGIASPTESASVGVLGALIVTLINKKLSIELLKNSGIETINIIGMVFMILFGATAFSLVFNEWGGGDALLHIFQKDVSSAGAFIFIAMLIIFVLGFFIDFMEIAFVVVPILLPIALAFKVDPLIFAIMIAMNLQTSFLTPPFGFALFFLKGAVGNLVKTSDIYLGAIPFIFMQLIVIYLIYLFPSIIK